MELTILTKLGIAPILSEAHLERIFERQEASELVWHYDLDYREITTDNVANLPTRELDLRVRAMNNLANKDPNYLLTDEFVERFELYRLTVDERYAAEKGYILKK
nr:hypothetical protein [Nanoarchaeum sp.]